MISKTYLIIFLLPLFCVSQTFTGRVVDKITQQPIETAAVYFDNTTIGTTTDSNGVFSIVYTDVVQSTLVISYLGYEKVFISDYRSQNNISIELVEADNALSEVLIEYDDGLTRRQKLRLFRKEFLGTSEFGKSCKIVNEDDLVLKYDKSNKALYVSSNAVLKIKNKALQYEISYDLADFEVNYKYVNLETKTFTTHSVVYFGTSFYKDLNKAEKSKTIKHRDHAFKGSVQHFMRALFHGSLDEDGYMFAQKRFTVNPYDFFTIYDTDAFGYKTVMLKEKLDIYYKVDQGSVIQTSVPKFNVDKYGNYSPIVGVYFSGVMGNQRVGDTLPLDYRFNKSEN